MIGIIGMISPNRIFSMFRASLSMSLSSLSKSKAMINIENTRLLLNKWAEYELISSSGYHPQSPVATLIQPRGTGAGSEPASIKASADVFNVVRILDDLRRQGFDDYVNVIRVWYLRLPNQQLATVAHSAGISVDAFKRLKVRAEEAVMHRLGACRYSG